MRKNLIRILGIPLVAGMFIFPSCDNWNPEKRRPAPKFVEEHDKKLDERAFKVLKENMCEVTNFKPSKGEGYLFYAAADMNQYPELKKIMEENNISLTSLEKFYKEINGGYLIFGRSNKIPSWSCLK